MDFSLKIRFLLSEFNTKNTHGLDSIPLVILQAFSLILAVFHFVTVGQSLKDVENIFIKSNQVSDQW